MKRTHCRMDGSVLPRFAPVLRRGGEVAGEVPPLLRPSCRSRPRPRPASTGSCRTPPCRRIPGWCLDLYGPTATTTTARGVAIFLTTDTSKATWVNPSTGSTSGSLIKVGSQFTLGSSPQLLADVASSGALQAGVFQKGGTAATYSDTTPILSVALAPVSGADLGERHLRRHEQPAVHRPERSQPWRRHEHHAQLRHGVGRVAPISGRVSGSVVRSGA